MKRAVVVLLLLIANAVFASSEVKPPDSGPGKLLAEWLRAYNGADATALRDFAEKHLTPEARDGRPAAAIAQNQIEGRQSSGGFELVKIETSSATELAAILKTRSVFPRFLRLSFKVSERDPALITERKVVMLPPLAEALAGQRSAEDLATELDAKFEELAKGERFSGTALIAKEGKPVWEKAYGLQDREKKMPANLETRFRLGSMNKMFTSVAIAQLVEAGKLKFGDTLAAVLPDYPNKDVAGKVTIEHLLTHTAGLGDIFRPGFFFEMKDNIRDHRDWLPVFADQPLEFEPGSRFSYSNAGFIVLGLVIEKVSGQSYYAYVQQHIFEPVGMTATGSTPAPDRVENLAIGYTVERSGKPAPNTPSLPWRGMAAGGGESNVGDLLRFATALRDYKLLSRETTDLITTGKVEDPPGSASKYAYGFVDRNVNGRRSVGHSGGAPGMNGSLNILWDEGYTVVVLANVDPTVAQDAAEYIADRLPAKARIARQ
ncbi:MAG: serine hydrolase [Chthoniobacterales bacterium]|nr:serine hydrolase [Chthoniobacterales bacterium]